MKATKVLSTSSGVEPYGATSGLKRRSITNREKLKSLNACAARLLLVFTLTCGSLKSIECDQLSAIELALRPMPPESALRDATKLENQTFARVVARQSKQQAEEDDGFIMKAVSVHESRVPQDTETTTNLSPDAPIATTSIPYTEDDRIAINATRQQFVTHDQLLNAATKDEQISIQSTSDRQNRSSQSVGAATSSRSGMPRLAFASSFLSDFLFRPRTTAAYQQQQQQQAAEPHQLASATTQEPTTASSYPQAQTTIQQQTRPPVQYYSSCPGVCLNLFVASLRCQNAIQAPCPSILQKCCEVDDVSFNGTPVETSAPLPPGDPDSNPPALHADVQQNSQPIGDNEQESSQASVRPTAPIADKQTGQQVSSRTETPATPSGQSQLQQLQITTSMPPDSRVSTPGAETTESHPHIGEQSRSVYFLSSGVDASDQSQHGGQSNASSPAATLTSEQDVKSVDQKRKQLLSPKPSAAAGNLAQPTSDHRPTASQSFDPPVTTTTTKPVDRIVVIQTANGTAYLHSGQASTSLQNLMRPHIRPMYANWTDYHLHMMQSRLPNSQHSTQQQQHNTVIYHSNIDPVRKYTSGMSTNQSEILNTSTRPTNDLTSNSAGLDSESKVLKDQHSAQSGQQQQQRQSEHSISSTTSASAYLATTTTTSSTSTTEGPKTATTTSEPETTTQAIAPNDKVNDDAGSMGLQQEGASSPVSGIANFLGSLFDSFMSDGGSANEARGTADQGMLSEQHNDRRLGLDLSFRQQNEMGGYNNNQTQLGGQDGENLMTSDESAPQVTHTGDQQQLQGCKGYCAQRQFWNLCDSHYPSSDCGRSQECCVTSAASGLALDAAQQDSTVTSGPSSIHNPVCRGACLPIYHSSLCMKPNEIQTEHPSCLPGQLCCSHPSILADGSNNLEDTSETDSSATTLMHPTPSLAGITDGSSNKDQSLSVALVPLPPPTASGGNLMDQNNGQADGRHLQTGSAQLNPYSISPQQAGYTTPQHSMRTSPTSRPTQYLAATTKANNQQTSASTSGGIMNQIFNMFKSSAGSNKQRSRPAQQTQPQLQTAMRPISPQQIIYELAQPQQLPSAHHLSRQHITTSASNMQPSIQSLSSQQIVFPQMQQQAAGTLLPSGPHRPILLAPSGQSFIATHPGGAYEPSIGGQKQLVTSKSYQLDQAAQHFADPVQFASAMQGQMSYRPPESQPLSSQQGKQYSQQAAVKQSQQQHSHPQPTLIMAPNEQQQIAMINAAANQLNFMNQQQPPPQQQQQQQTRSNYQHNRLAVPHHQAHPGAPTLALIHQQQPSRWTHPGHSLVSTDSMTGSSSNSNAHRYHQQMPPNKRPGHQQLDQVKLSHLHPHETSSGTNSLSFGPADAASTVASGGQYPTLQNGRPIVTSGNSNSWQQTGWLGSSPSGHDGQFVSNTNLDQQKRQKLPSGMSVSENNGRLPAPITHNNEPQPEADTNIVSALTSSQPTPKKPLLQSGQVPGLNQVPLPQSFTNKPAHQIRVASLPRIVPTTTTSTTSTTSTTQSPPVRPLDASITGLTSSSSNLNPVHAPAEAASDSDESGIADSSQPRPVVVSDSATDQGQSNQKATESAPVTPTPGVSPQLSSGNPGDNDPAAADDGESSASGLQQPQTPQEDLLTEVTAQSVTAVSGGNLLSDSSGSTISTNYDQSASTRGKVASTVCGLPGPDRLSLNSVAGRARAGRVMGGFDSEPDYWCWQAALMNGKNEYLCGGALIGTKWVLTAAHCVTQHLRSESQLYVRLGQTNLNSSSLSERRSAKSVLVKTSYVHHNHNGVTLDNDIALLRLEDSVDLGEPGICTVCLPERNSKPLEVGRRCTVTGYGFESEQGPAALRVRQTDLPIVADDQCQKQTSKILQKPFVLPASSFCAGGELGQDACHGDGGSPLACQVDGYYELTGIVSWGYKCGSKDLPGLYAKVSNFVGWINQIVSVNS